MNLIVIIQLSEFIYYFNLEQIHQAIIQESQE